MENLEDDVGSGCSLIDLAKSFDTVYHNNLFKKREQYGLRVKVVNFLRSNLQNRKQFVCYNNSLTDTRTV